MPIPSGRSGAPHGAAPRTRAWPYEIGEILRESLEHEEQGLAAYQDLLALAEGRSILLEEYVRRLIGDETKHVGEVHKMLRPPGTPPST
jgi:bacterioferritin